MARETDVLSAERQHGKPRDLSVYRCVRFHVYGTVVPPLLLDSFEIVSFPAASAITPPR